MSKIISLFIAVFLWCNLCHGQGIKVAVASNFKATAQHIADEFQRTTNHKVTLISGSSSALFNMISHGAPFDIFLSADRVRPLKLINLQLADSNSLVNYANGQLVFLSPQSIISSLDQLISHLKNQDGKLAIANPKLAPYGESSMNFIKKNQLIKTVKPHLVIGNNVIQTLQFITSSNANSGFVAYSQIIQANIQHNYFVLPPDSYFPIKQFGVILAHGRHKTAALEFMSFLKNNSTNLIKQAGYLLEPTHEP